MTEPITTTTTNEEFSMHAHHLARRAVGVVAAAALALLVPGIVSPGVAHAGEYAQHFCQSGPGDRRANAWYTVGGGTTVHCHAGAAAPSDGVYHNTQTMPLNGYGGVRFDAPPGARYRRLTVNLQVPYQAQNRRTYIESGSAYVFSWWNGWGGTSSFNPDGNSITLSLLDTPAVEIGQACHGASAAGCQAGDFYFSGAVATLSDTTAPTVAAGTGEGLFAPSRTAFRGSVSAVADITDHGHGPATAALQVDGADVPGATAHWLGACNYRLPTPCSQRPGWRQSVDTAAHPDGVHTVRVVATDGVGQAGYAERTVTFDNTAPVLSGTPSFAGETHSGDRAAFAVSATDATSGLAALESAVDGGPFTAVAGESGTVTAEGAGTHTVVVRARDHAGNVAEQSSTFTLQAPPDNQRIATTQDGPLPGAPGPGDTIKCDVGSPWSDGTTFAYRWLRDGAVIEGAGDQTYEVTGQDAGRALACRVEASNEAGTTTRATEPVTAGSERCFGQVGPTDPCGDFDHDGQDNQTDPDDDGDGVPDGEDPAPFDPNVPGGGGSGGTGASGTGGAGVPGGTGASGGGSVSLSGVLGVPNNGVNASNRARITVTGKRRRKVRFGRRIATVAHLRDESGRPITGALVTVLERMNVPGAQWVPARPPLVSDGRGRLRWIIPARYSRTIRYAYKANLANADFQSTSDVVLSVLAKSSLRVSRSAARNGQKVVFGGRVASRPIPRGGVLIDLQARVGRRWQTFRTRRTRGNGRWAVGYRFTSTRGTRTYRFRARVRQDTGYPYAMARTRAVRVKVTG